MIIKNGTDEIITALWVALLTVIEGRFEQFDCQLLSSVDTCRFLERRAVHRLI